MPVPIVVTKMYEPTTQTHRDPNRDKCLARSDQPRTSETYRPQVDMSSGMNYSFYCCIWNAASITTYREDCLMCCPSNKVIKSDTISCLALGRIHEDKVCGTLQAMVPTNIKMVHQTSVLHIESNLDRLGLLSPTHGQRCPQQSGRITLQSVLINKPKFLKATHHTEIGEN